MLRKIFSVFVLLLFAYVVVSELSGAGGRKSSAGFPEVPRAQAQKIHADLGGLADNPPLVVFVTSWCGICTALENDLRSAGVPFVTADVEKNPKAALYYQSLTQGRMLGVPVTLAGTQVFLGHQLRNILGAIRNDERATR